jgi:hypothetical protein
VDPAGTDSNPNDKATRQERSMRRSFHSQGRVHVPLFMVPRQVSR